MSSSLFKPNSGTGLQAIGGKKGKGPLDPNKKNAKNVKSYLNKGQLLKQRFWDFRNQLRRGGGHVHWRSP